ncbi:MAG: type I-U CRISPR-associated RAMP protein Csb1/Cas7u [Acidobacteria bacterium]|nr:type I-U CRISPR-associated RAMP protein Csb1/Cas7u [Acidobacteriota bacterium]
MNDQFGAWLTDDGPVALIIKQELRPVDEEDPVIFPPTYPMTTYKARIHTIRDGDYRVSIELPPDSKTDKNEKKEDQKPGYNIDRFPDGTNSCEIDSPQSQSNRIEPRFKKIKNGTLVPQIEIKVGKEIVNLLDAGHRAADAVVRMSSLADKFHDAFLAAKSRNYFELAKYAPTSLVFGVWDSRSTYEKRQRILKAHIRATNVLERSKSAQYTPAVDYVGSGAIDEELDRGKGDDNNLSVEGMKHALSTQTVGGVMLTAKSKLVRTVNLNLAAVRELPGATDDESKALQEYILALSLVSAASEPDLNLREGCNLRFKGTPTVNLVYRSKDDEPLSLDLKQIEQFAEDAAKRFFQIAGIEFDKKDHRDAVFETAVAENYLSRTTEERKKISQLGPITAATVKRFDEQGKDPFKLTNDALKAALKALGKKPGKNKPPIKNIEALKEVCDALRMMSENTTLPDAAQFLASELLDLSQNHEDSHAVLREIDMKVKEFKKAQKADSVAATGSDSSSEANQ